MYLSYSGDGEWHTLHCIDFGRGHFQSHYIERQSLNFLNTGDDESPTTNHYKRLTVEDPRDHNSLVRASGYKAHSTHDAAHTHFKNHILCHGDVKGWCPGTYWTERLRQWRPRRRRRRLRLQKLHSSTRSRFRTTMCEKRRHKGTSSLLLAFLAFVTQLLELHSHHKTDMILADFPLCVLNHSDSFSTNNTQVKADADFWRTLCFLARFNCRLRLLLTQE